MNILITGATGFIGSRLLEMSGSLFGKDDQLILLTSEEIEGCTCIIHHDFSYSVADFYEKGINKIDKVIHIGHFLSELHPEISASEGNLSSINNTVYLMNNLPNVPDAIIYCSSMAVYGVHREDAVDEFSTLMPDDSYAVSKIMIEMYLKDWASRNRTRLHTLRLPHIYGPNDKRNYTIPIWLKAVLKDQQIKVFTNSNQKRNCLYIDDCCRFLAKACYLENDVNVINLASEHNSTMGELAEICRKVSGNRLEVVYESENLLNKGLQFKNCDLRKKLLGDEGVSLEEGLHREFEYYCKFGNR